MEEERKFVIVGGIGLLFIFTFALVASSPPLSFYWGVSSGLIFGIGMCVYLSQVWDPYLLAPKNPNTERASWKVWWVVPLGMLLAKLLSGYIREDIWQILLGTVVVWLYITFIYFIIQAWRYR